MSLVSTSKTFVSPRADWLRAAKWGLFFHYLAAPASSREPIGTSSQAWNARVDSFDVSRFVSQVAQTGARYVMWTLGQNSGHFCSPNATYDQLTRISPSKCSRRDLWWEIAVELRKHDIQTLAYLPSHAPVHDQKAQETLGFTPSWDAGECGLGRRYPENGDERLSQFCRNWEAVVREWSERWGELCAGWWLDGVYFADKMYAHPDAPNFDSFAQALRAGNSDAILAFNTGVKTPLRRSCGAEDYTAGELAGDLSVAGYFPDGFHAYESPIDGAQLHVLTFLGEYWGKGEPRFPDELVVGYTQYLNARGGAITWDVPVSETGEIAPAFLHQLQKLR